MILQLVEMLLWSSLLGVVAVRPWVLDVPERVSLVQWIGLLAGLVWCIMKWSPMGGVARVEGSRVQRGLPPSLAGPCLIVLLAFLVSSFGGYDRREIFLQGHGLVFGMLLCAGVALASQSQRQQLRWILLGTGTLLSLHALWQAFVLFPALTNFPWNELTAEGRLTGIPAHTVEYATQVIERRRVFGPFPLPGLLGAALAMLLPLSVATLTPVAHTLLRRLITIAVWGLQTIALLLTQSLAAISSTGAAIVLVLVLRRSAWRSKLAILCVTVVSVGILLAIRPELSGRAHPRNPIVQRWRYWVSTVHMIRAHPLRGVGAGNYVAVYPRYRRPLATDTRFAHNAFLHVWAEWGVLGVIGLLGLFIGSVRLAARQPAGHQIAIWAFWFMAFIDVTWSYPQLTCLWWPLLGLSTIADGESNVSLMGRA